MGPFDDIVVEISQWLQQRRKGKEVFCLGIAGAQGSGKTTLSRQLADCLERDSVSVCTLSLDDFYKTRAEREALGLELHPLFRTRGVPGTHDMTLMNDVLATLLRRGEVRVPVFDKAADDRRQDWRVIPPAQVIIVEGWCWGACPADDAALAEPLNTLEANRDPDGTWRGAVNDFLASEAYQGAFSASDALLYLEVPDFDAVFRWRLQQERELKPIGDERVMDEKDIREFIMYYERISRRMLQDMPRRADIVVRLNASHGTEEIAFSD